MVQNAWNSKEAWLDCAVYWVSSWQVEILLSLWPTLGGVKWTRSHWNSRFQRILTMNKHHQETISWTMAVWLWSTTVNISLLQTMSSMIQVFLLFNVGMIHVLSLDVFWPHLDQDAMTFPWSFPWHVPWNALVFQLSPPAPRPYLSPLGRYD